MTTWAIEKAVELAKAAMPMQTGTWMSTPDTVAKFVEVVSTKLDELAKRKG